MPWRRARQHSSILAWRIPWTEEAGELQSIVWGCNEWDTTEATQHGTYNVVYSNRNSVLEARCQEGHDLSEEARGRSFSPLLVSECQQSPTFFCLIDASLKSLPLPSRALHRCPFTAVSVHASVPRSFLTGTPVPGSSMTSS